MASSIICSTLRFTGWSSATSTRSRWEGCSKATAAGGGDARAGAVGGRGPAQGRPQAEDRRLGRAGSRRRSIRPSARPVRGRWPGPGPSRRTGGWSEPSACSKRPEQPAATARARSRCRCRSTSITRSPAHPSARKTRRLIVPWAVNFIALENRLIRIWRSRIGVALDRRPRRPARCSMLEVQALLSRPAAATGRPRRARCRPRWKRLVADLQPPGLDRGPGPGCRPAPPAGSWPRRRSCATISRWRAVSRRLGQHLGHADAPRSAGVRISWLILARNSLLARLAASASSRRCARGRVMSVITEMPPPRAVRRSCTRSQRSANWCSELPRPLAAGQAGLDPSSSRPRASGIEQTCAAWRAGRPRNRAPAAGRVGAPGQLGIGRRSRSHSGCAGRRRPRRRPWPRSPREGPPGRRPGPGPRRRWRPGRPAPERHHAGHRGGHLRRWTAGSRAAG